MPATLVAAAGVLGVIFGAVAHRLDHRCIDLPLSCRCRDRPVSGHEGIDRGAFDGQAAPIDPDRVLLWGFSRGYRWWRSAGCHLRLVLDRARFRALPGSDTLLDRQYGAGGLGSSRQSDSSVGDCHGASRNGLERHDRPDLAPTVGDPAILAGSQYGRVGATFEVWPALAVSGLSFALVQFYWSNYQESGLVDIIAAFVSLLAMVAFLKVWQPKASQGNR